MNDGVLGLTIAGEVPNLYGFVLVMLAIMGGRHGFSRKISFHQARNMRIECKTDTFVQIDGEAYRLEAGRVIDVSVVPHALRVLVPEESLTNRKLPFAPGGEPPEQEQLELLPPRDDVSEELKDLSGRAKAHVEHFLRSTIWGRSLLIKEHLEERRNGRP